MRLTVTIPRADQAIDRLEKLTSHFEGPAPGHLLALRGLLLAMTYDPGAERPSDIEFFLGSEDDRAHHQRISDAATHWKDAVDSGPEAAQDEALVALAKAWDGERPEPILPADLVAQVEDRFGAAFVCVNGEGDGPDFIRADVVLQLLAEARRPEGA